MPPRSRAHGRRATTPPAQGQSRIAGAESVLATVSKQKTDLDAKQAAEQGDSDDGDSGSNLIVIIVVVLLLLIIASKSTLVLP